MQALKAHFGDRMCIREGIYGEAYNRFWNECRVGVNCSPLGESTVRVYEVMATGTALVTDRSEDLEKLFQNNVHLLMYEDEDEAIACCERLLSDAALRRKIADNGRRAVARYEWTKNFEYLVDEAVKFVKAQPVGEIRPVKAIGEPVHKEPKFV